MIYLITDMYDWYRDLMDNKSDPRVQDWPLMSSPLPTMAICLFYAYFSKVMGPRIMANRKPMNLRNILVVYNLIQTIFSAWIFYEYLQSGWWGHYSFKCQPVDYSRSPRGMRMANTCWWYFIAKFTEFFDTLFFILRHKMEHVSTLHVIHHGCMPFSVWMGMKFAPGGHSTFFAMLNSFVHIVMYFYYMLAAMGPRYQKFIWWKKYLTTFQMVQFVAIFAHQFQLLFRDCNYPKGFMVWIGLHGVMFLFLFSDFYKAKYSRPSKGKAKDSKADHTTSNGKIHTNGNQGACMPVLNDDDDQMTKNKLNNGFHHHNGYANGGVTNGHTSDQNHNGLINGDAKKVK
uniref:Elongation of very long chain fatty acids protein n=2 Tax=Nyssomyia neivai TaxID=330878 RepID=A0A1L8DY78_9DIPT